MWNVSDQADRAGQYRGPFQTGFRLFNTTTIQSGLRPSATVQSCTSVQSRRCSDEPGDNSISERWYKCRHWRGNAGTGIGRRLRSFLHQSTGLVLRWRRKKMRHTGKVILLSRSSSAVQDYGRRFEICAFWNDKQCGSLILDGRRTRCGKHPVFQQCSAMIKSAKYPLYILYTYSVHIPILMAVVFIILWSQEINFDWCPFSICPWCSSCEDTFYFHFFHSKNECLRMNCFNLNLILRMKFSAKTADQGSIDHLASTV